MAEEKSAAGTTPKTAPAAARPKKFGRPESFEADAGVAAQTDDQVSGYVLTAQLRKLLDSFGIDERKEIQLPYQIISRRGGEQFRLRVETADYHTVAGQLVLAHHWAFTQDIPEKVGTSL